MKKSMLPTTQLIAAFGIILLASTVKGLTGFGFALTSLPLLTIFISPKVAVPIITICSVFLDGYTFYKARKVVQYRVISPLVVSGVIGMMFGTYFLVSLNSGVLKLGIGAVTLLFAGASLFGFKREIGNVKLASIPIGFLSGFLGGAISISGPPVALFFSNQGVEKTVFRANLIAYFFCLYLATVPAYFLSGLITRELLVTSLILVPSIFIGANIGIGLLTKVNDQVFRKITMYLVMITGLMAVLSGLGLI